MIEKKLDSHSQYPICTNPIYYVPGNCISRANLLVTVAKLTHPSCDLFCQILLAEDMVHDTETLTFSAAYRMDDLHIAMQPSTCLHKISRFHADQIAHSLQNSADVICSHTDGVTPFRIYIDCEDNTLSNLTLILHACSGKAN